MKHGIKTVFFLFFVLLMLPVSAVYFIVSVFGNKDEVLASFSQVLALFPTKIGSFIRIGFYRLVLTRCHPNSRIGFMVLFSQQDTELEEGIYIGPQCNIGRCSIGKDSLLGSAVHIMSGKKQHNFELKDIPIRDQGGHFEKVRIGENCWVGNGALIMANVGNNCVVAAGSVVVSDVPENTIVAGNPAKVIKQR